MRAALARQRGIDLSRIPGSGPRGRIKAADVEAAPPFGGWQARSPTSVPALTDRAERRRPATQTEKIVARRLTTAKQTIPHFYVLAEADVTFLLRVREELNADGKAVRISVNHFVLAAVGRALAADAGDERCLAGGRGRHARRTRCWHRRRYRTQG